MSGSIDPTVSSYRPLKRYVATWDYEAAQQDEISLSKGDIILVAEEFDDGWMRGLRVLNLEIGFFPANYVAEDISPVYKLQEIKLSTDHYVNDPKFVTNNSTKRSRIALELYTSEDVYFNKLTMLNEMFVNPLDVQGVISQEDYNAVFPCIKPLIGLSEALVLQLKSRMEGWDERHSCLADIFLHMGNHLKLFVNYAMQHTVGSQVINKIMKQDRFKAWLEKAELECQRTLNSFLLEPIQRVPRYELLLKDLLKHTSEDHRDFQATKEALAIVQKIAVECNEGIRHAENEIKLLKISRSFPSESVAIIRTRQHIAVGKDRRRKTLGSANKRNKINGLLADNKEIKDTFNMSFQSFFESEHQRTFVREGHLYKTTADFTDPAERTLILCSDVLLIAIPISRSKKTFKLRERVQLVQIWATDTLGKGSERGFSFGTPCKTYHFLASSREEKTSWFSDLYTNILAQKQLLSKLLTHLSIPDEIFECLPMKAKVDYIGFVTDELSFNCDDEIMVFGFQDNSEAWRPGLYKEEPFDPTPEWYFGTFKGNMGWFPAKCVSKQQMDPTQEYLKPPTMRTVLKLRQRMVELTGRQILPLSSEGRIAKVSLGEETCKTLRITDECQIETVIEMFFKVIPEGNYAWSLSEQSVDGTVDRLLEVDELPSSVVDFWGKNKDQMRLVIKQTLINTIESSEA